MPDVASLTAAQTFTAPQRGSAATENDGSFDLSAKNFFDSTPTGAVTLTFTNIPTDRQSGHIVLVNGASYTISKASHVKCPSSMLATISATGMYLLSYYTKGTDVLIVSSESLS